jgi:hypothetical protein
MMNVLWPATRLVHPSGAGLDTPHLQLMLNSRPIDIVGSVSKTLYLSWVAIKKTQFWKQSE